MEKREFESISEEAESQEKRKKGRKKPKAEVEFEEECRRKWKILSKNFLCTLNLPSNVLSLPQKQTALRSLQAQAVEHQVGPMMWDQGPNYQDKSGIVCLFEVTAFFFE